MTITLKKNSVDVRVELRRNDSDFIGDDRAYYTYFFSKAGCFGSAKVTEKSGLSDRLRIFHNERKRKLQGRLGFSAAGHSQACFFPQQRK